MSAYQAPPDMTPRMASRMGARWLMQSVPVTVNLPPDVHAELAERAAFDGIALEERLAWLLTELVRGSR